MPLANPPQTIISLSVHTAVWFSGDGRVGGVGGCPTVGAGIVSAAGVQIVIGAMSAPDDHFAAGPHCRVTVSARGRVGGAGGCPTIRAGIVSAAGVQIAGVASSAPDDHFTAGPHCRVNVSASGRVGGAGGCPTIRAGIVSPAGVQIGRCRSARPRRSFRCRSRLLCDRFGQWARWWCWWPSNCRCWDCICRRCSKASRRYHPPQTIISLPVQTAV